MATYDVFVTTESAFRSLIAAVGLAFAAVSPAALDPGAARRARGRLPKALPDAVDIIVRGIGRGLPLFNPSGGRSAWSRPGEFVAIIKPSVGAARRRLHAC